MKALAHSLTLSALLLTAQAQAPATSHDNPTPAKSTTKTAKGHTGAKGSKNLGQKMVDNSKPTDMYLPVPSRPVNPVKQ